MAITWNGYTTDTVDEMIALQRRLAEREKVTPPTRRPNAERVIHHIEGPGSGPYAPGVTWDDIDRGTHSEWGPK